MVERTTIVQTGGQKVPSRGLIFLGRVLILKCLDENGLGSLERTQSRPVCLAGSLDLETLACPPQLPQKREPRRNFNAAPIFWFNAS